MKNKLIRRLVLSLTAIGVAAFCFLPFASLLTGCKTATTSTAVVTLGTNGVLMTNYIVATNTTILGITITPVGVYTALRSGANEAARLGMASDTNVVTYVSALYQALGGLIASTNYNPAALQAAIASVSAGKITSPTALIAVNGAITTLTLLLPTLQQQVHPGVFILAALQGVHDGLGDAQGLVNAVPTLPTSSLRLSPEDSHAYAAAFQHLPGNPAYAKR